LWSRKKPPKRTKKGGFFNRYSKKEGKGEVWNVESETVLRYIGGPSIFLTFFGMTENGMIDFMLMIL
jgi:hypothetical protein